jgi:hypothetical protein
VCFLACLLHHPSYRVDGAKCEALNEKDAMGHCSMVVNKVLGMDKDIQLGKMLIDTFQRCDELHENFGGQARTIDGSLLDGGDFIDGNDNLAIEFDLEGMDLEHDDDYDETILFDMFREAQTPLYEVVPLVTSPPSFYHLICVVHMESTTCLWMNSFHY